MKTNESLVFLAIDSITPNRHQPRREFDQKALDELAASIESVGLLQPIVVKPISDPENYPQSIHYELVAGERRWRAHQLLDRSFIKAIISHRLDNIQAHQAVLIENLQRQDLNPIEEAVAYKTLMQTQRLTQQQLAQQLGKTRPYIAQMVRLVKLQERTKELVVAKKLTRYHAYLLAGVEDEELQVKLAEQTVTKKWSIALLTKQIKFALEKFQQLDDYHGERTTIYTNNIKAPIYEIRGETPQIRELLDTTKTLQLIEKIKESALPQDVADFLIAAAHRHTIFNFSKIAEFYANSDSLIQELMEESALVLIDFDSAIEYGYVKLTDNLRALFKKEH